MKRIVKVYLCGSIKKGASDRINRKVWGPEEEDAIISSFGSEWNVELLNPATVGIKRVDSFNNFGGDMYYVKISDFIFVDARDRRGIGIGGEMFAAKYFGIPVVSLCPVGSHYRKDYVEDLCGENVNNWIHPFITGLSDYISDDIPGAINWMKNFIELPTKVKSIDIVNEAIRIFKKNQNIED